jgi:hypothetical protein
LTLKAAIECYYSFIIIINSTMLVVMIYSVIISGKLITYWLCVSNKST